MRPQKNGKYCQPLRKIVTFFRGTHHLRHVCAMDGAQPPPSHHLPLRMRRIQKIRQLAE